MEVRLPWACSFAWKSLLDGVRFSDEGLEENILDLSDQVREMIPDRIENKINSFSKDVEANALVIRNCPVDSMLPPTPRSGRISSCRIPVGCLVNLILYRLFDIEPIVYQGENGGNVFRHVVPARNKESFLSSHGSHMDFGYHVDNPDLPLMSEPIGELSACPEFLSLFGMRCDSSVRTTLVEIDRALDCLPQEIVHSLERPEFTVRRPQSFGMAKKTPGLPLIAKDRSNQWLCRFDAENIEAESVDGARAIDALCAALSRKEIQNDILLLPGDFLIFKNQRVVHARNSFSPKRDGADRWLIRLFGVESLARVLMVSSENSFEVVA